MVEETGRQRELRTRRREIKRGTIIISLYSIQSYKKTG